MGESPIMPGAAAGEAAVRTNHAVVMALPAPDSIVWVYCSAVLRRPQHAAARG